MSEPLVSILINNYNYAEYVGAAIDSALAQDYPVVEVLVVDDGSTDDSRRVISSYGDRIVPIFKQNGGQPSAFNAGVAASRGQILCFLDADDSFSPDKVRCVVETFRNEGLNSRPLMVHHLLAMRSDTDSELDGKPFGKTHQSPMNLQSFAHRHRFIWYEAGPTTAISLNRVLADRLFPIPEKGVRISGDDFIVSGAYLLGEVYSLADMLGTYRVHGNNQWFCSDRKKSPEFLSTLQRYLNEKLQKTGNPPLISFDDSIYAWAGLLADRRWLKLAWHMLRISIRDHDRYTAEFVYHTTMTIGMMIMRTLRQRRDLLIRRFGAGGPIL